MLQKVAFQFPRNEPADEAVTDPLSELFASIPDTENTDSSVLVTPPVPEGSRPVTEISGGSVGHPSIILHTSQEICLFLGGATVRSIGGASGQISSPPSSELVQPQGMTAATLLEKFRGHIVRMDHAGVNFPSSQISHADFDNLLSKLGAVSALYDYPGGEPWHFILPATEMERAQNIESFPAGRGPKFELVRDEYTSVPILQFDLETDLSREAVEKLLPEPFGVGLPELDQFFRSVFLDHPWPNLSIRFDFRYCNSDPTNDWATGEWLVLEGGRHNNRMNLTDPHGQS